MERTPLDQPGERSDDERLAWIGRRWTSGEKVPMTRDWHGEDDTGPAGRTFR